MVKNGHRPNGSQRWPCKGCRKSFLLDYRYQAHKPGVREQVAEHTLNSSEVRYISRNLKINKNTVVNVLKKKLVEVNPYLLDKVEVGQLQQLEVELHLSTEWACDLPDTINTTLFFYELACNYATMNITSLSIIGSTFKI